MEVRIVATRAPGVELVEVGEEVLAFDGSMLTRLTGPEAAAALSADGVVVVRDPDAAADLAARGLLVLAAPLPGERFRRPDHVGFCEDGDHVVVLDLRTGYQHVLSDSAAEIWWQIVDGGSLDEAVADLEAAFPDATSLRDEAEVFVRDLVAQGLLERV